MNILFMIKTGESCVSLNGHIGPRIMFLIIEPGMVIISLLSVGWDLSQVIQSLVNTCLFGIRS